MDPEQAVDDAVSMDALAAQIALSFVTAMEAKSPYLRGHSNRVAACAAAIAHELGMDEAAVEEVRLAGWLHDVGKIGIRDEVLNKPAGLSAEEMQHVQDHVVMGVRILTPLGPLGHVIDYIAHHHERIDGSGYPAGLRGDDISLGGRIIGAADVLDAITSPRAYRKALALDEALHYMASCGPRVVCPVVLPALARLVEAGQVLVFIDHHEQEGQ